MLAQHVARVGPLHQGAPLSLGKAHQRGLRDQAGFIILWRSSAPEAIEPWQQVRQIHGLDRQRSERVGQPLGKLLDHALVGQRQHVGESQRGGVARTCFLADTGTVEDCDVVARLDEIRRGADTDDAGADNGDLPAVAAQSRRLRLKYRGGAGSGCTGCGKVRQVGVAHSRAIPAKCVVVLHLELRKQGDRTISQSGEKRNRSKFGAILSVPRRAWEATLRTGLRRQRRGVPTR